MSSYKSLPLLLPTITEFFGNNCFNVSSVPNKCLRLLIILLTFEPWGLNLAKNIIEVDGAILFLSRNRT